MMSRFATISLLAHYREGRDKPCNKNMCGGSTVNTHYYMHLSNLALPI